MDGRVTSLPVLMLTSRYATSMWHTVYWISLRTFDLHLLTTISCYQKWVNVFLICN